MKSVLRFFIFFTLSLVADAGLYAQNTWTGAVSSDWNTAANWIGGVPSAVSEVRIPGATNNPLIQTSTALAFSIEVQSGGILNIVSGGKLTINTTAPQAILNRGTVENNGIINIENLSGTSNYGIINESTFNNNYGSQILIDNVSIMAIHNIGTFSNWGTITLGANNVPGATGIQNNLNFYNYYGAHISIDRTSGTALINDGGYFNSDGYINIGDLYSCQSGITNINLGAFRNTNELTIDRIIGTGISNLSGTCNNRGSITIGKNASAGSYGIMNSGTFQNEGGGTMQIDRASTAGISNGLNFYNQGDIKLGTLSSVGNYGIYNTGDLRSHGNITIEQVANTGIYNNGTGFANYGSLTIDGSAGTVDIGIDNYATFNNNNSGIITLKSVNDGIVPNAGSFNNKATIITNSPSQVSTLITPGTSGTFINSTNGIINASATIYTDNYVDAGGTLAPGDNVGKLVFDGSNSFDNSNLAIEIPGTGISGTNFDAVAVMGTATMGGNLIITMPGFTPTPGQSFVILTATAVTGQFASVSWPAGVAGSVTYGATTVTLNILAALPLTLVEFSGNAAGNKTLLQWKTADEVNTSAFEIERSTNSIDYTTIGNVNAIGNGANHYNSVDERPVAGSNYYRLKMKDLNGKFTISRVVIVKHGANDGLQLAPIPSRSFVTVQLKDPMLLNQRAQVYNSMGNLVTEVVLINGLGIDITGWPVGIYTLKTNTASYRLMKL